MCLVRVLLGEWWSSVWWLWGDRWVSVHLVRHECGSCFDWALCGYRVAAGCTFSVASTSMARRLYLAGSAAHGNMLHEAFLAHGCMHVKGPFIHAPQSLTYMPPFRGLSLAFGLRVRALTCRG